MTSILIIGAGFVAAPFIEAVRKSHPSIPTTVYLRSTRIDGELASIGVSIVHGTYEEVEKISELSSKHSLVVNAADSENVSLTKAVIKGVSKGKGTVLHVSGAGNFFDDATDGKMIPDSKIWDDANEDDIRLIHDGMKNGPCDKLVLEAAARGDIKSFIVCPVGVYGVLDSKLTTSLGVFVSGIAGNATHLGYSPYLNDGTTVFQLVHVDDVVQLMLLVLDQALKNEPNQNPYKQYYVTAGEAVEWKEIAAVFGEALHRSGKIKSAEPVRATREEAGPTAGFMQGSMKVTENNARSLGYKPTGESFAASLAKITF